MNLDLTNLRSDLSSWPALRHRILGGWSYVLTAVAFIAVAVPILLTGLVTLLINLGRLLCWLSGLLDSIGSYLQQARPALEHTPQDDPALDPLARLVATSEELTALRALVDDTDPVVPVEGYVIAMPASPISGSPVPDSPVPDSHVTASRPRTRKRSAGAGKRTAAAGFNAGPAGSAG